jgi:histidinol-phosphate aminotransferase
MTQAEPAAFPWHAERLPPAIAALRAYDPGHDLVAWRRRFGAVLAELGSNENPVGPAPGALAAARDALAQLHRYPDPLGGGLKRALAVQLGVEPAQLALGNGSHELLMMIAQAFVPAGAPVVHSQYGFAVFAIAAAAVGAHGIAVAALPVDAAMPRGHDLDALAAACTSDTRLLFLANPNNPTGTWFGREALAPLLDRVSPGTLVVVDEAYHEYQPDPAATTAVPLIARHRNLIVTRTFSKAYGLAGLRVGYAVGAPEAIAVLERLRESFNVNAVALAAAEAALADTAHLQRVIAHNDAERARMVAALRTMGLALSPSRTNFVLVDFGDAARCTAVEARLREQAVIVRPTVGYGLPGCLRVSIGSAAENNRFLSALAQA